MIARNLEKLKDSIVLTARRCGRDENGIHLVAVSKRFPAEAVIEAHRAGQILFGENYIQEAEEKHLCVPEDIRFHFIGHLQTNKAKTAARIFSMVETVDRKKLAVALNKHLTALGKKLDILVQVNIGRDGNKSGADPETVGRLLEEIAALPMLRPRGLMTMPPFTDDPEDARPYYRDLRLLAESMAAKKLFIDNKNVELSMGMTNDYQVAIEEGATLVRVGTAIFGERPPKT